MDRHRIAIVGFGKIARDRHLPSIRADPHFELVAIVSRTAIVGAAAPVFTELEQLFSNGPVVDAVVICTPPGPRYDLARKCIDAGVSLFLEKPPTVTLGEAQHLVRLAEERKIVLFTSWHARCHASVTNAAAIVAEEGLRSLQIRWLEDVEKWHPGQSWVRQAGGFGVFDAGINGLSIATMLSPQPLLVRSASLYYPRGWQAPIAAVIQFDDLSNGQFDWRHKDEECWTIQVQTCAGTELLLDNGGSKLSVNMKEQNSDEGQEYSSLYSRFHHLLIARRSEVELEPLRIVSDVFLTGKRVFVGSIDMSN
jgi:D-galactose 1-dehydrogenase